MIFDWGFIKNLFYILAPIGTIFAVYNKIVESKFNRDLEKIIYIKSLVNEQALVNLEYEVYQVRQVPRQQFSPFDKISHEVKTNQETVRFSGPLAKYLKIELDNLIGAYLGLREYIQVNEWLPNEHKYEDGTKFESWDFNKNATAFSEDDVYPKHYGKHLDDAAEQAAKMKKAFNRFQMVSELHLFEAPFASYLLKKRFKEFNLQNN